MYADCFGFDLKIMYLAKFFKLCRLIIRGLFYVTIFSSGFYVYAYMHLLSLLTSIYFCSLSIDSLGRNKYCLSIYFWIILLSLLGMLKHTPL